MRKSLSLTFFYFFCTFWDITFKESNRIQICKSLKKEKNKNTQSNILKKKKTYSEFTKIFRHSYSFLGWPFFNNLGLGFMGFR